jgi:glycogen debranching enzyme
MPSRARSYYGSIDSTPLFVMLAARYFQRTGDTQTMRELWPHIDAALSWIDQYGDRDGDGFVEYYRVSENGLTNQGWKDSSDSIMHADGTLATGPIALCEVQGYVYAAKKEGAVLATALGYLSRAHALDEAADKLRVAFEEKFWIAELGTYAIALDGAKAQCRVRSSNAGQVLACGIASAERAQIVGKGLMTPELFSGWGIRTLGADAPRFNPMSYHNGSVWPHDNAIIALGLARYGQKRAAAAIFEGRRAHGDDALPRTILRLPAPPRHRAGAVPGGLRAAGLGQRGAVRAAAGVPGAGDVLRQARDPLQQSAAAALPGRDRHQWADAGRRQRQPAPAPPRRQHGGRHRVKAR